MKRAFPISFIHLKNHLQTDNKFSVNRLLLFRFDQPNGEASQGLIY